MKRFENQRELYDNISQMQDDVYNYLQEYIEQNSINHKNFEEKLYGKYNEVLIHIFELLAINSKGLDFIIEHIEDEDGETQLLCEFIRAYISEKIMDEVIIFENMNKYESQK